MKKILILIGLFISITVQSQIIQFLHTQQQYPIGNGIKLFILSGQSNMANTSIATPLDGTEYEPWLKHYTNVKYLDLRVAGGFTSFADYNVTLSSYVGCELGIIKTLSDYYPDETIYVVKAAKGDRALGHDTLYDEEFYPDIVSGTLFPQYIYKGDSTAWVEEAWNWIKTNNPGQDVIVPCFFWNQIERDGYLIALGKAVDPDYSVTSKLLISKMREYFNSNYMRYSFMRAHTNIGGSEYIKNLVRGYQDSVAAFNPQLNFSINCDTITDYDGLHFGVVGWCQLGQLQAQAYINSL